MFTKTVECGACKHLIREDEAQYVGYRYYCPEHRKPFGYIKIPKDIQSVVITEKVEKGLKCGYCHHDKSRHSARCVKNPNPLLKKRKITQCGICGGKGHNARGCNA